MMRSTSNNFTKYTYYTHLNSVQSDITVGAVVRQGELLGKTGSTGNAYNIPADRYHTHICVIQDGTNESTNEEDAKFWANKRLPAVDWPRRFQTAQADSEVLLVNNETVWYRSDDTIFSAHLADSTRWARTEILKDDRVRDIHWAYLKD